MVIAALLAVSFASCQQAPTDHSLPLKGTWELVDATTIEQDSSYSTFDASHKMIKIINDTHFAFLNHSAQPADSAKHFFSAGGGTYTLTDSTYTEHLDYFSDPAWEHHTFAFTVTLRNDTLIQKGVEKVEKLGIDRVIIEKYVRSK
ncbi:hypothetical protein BLX24_19095 [Arsenicibacter rosenii]|uniref:Uncharacterized protein n=2 Tax=Arsenicibacter rosenii TaxID=1750698 RepID=A0A1S2VG03_9BACT|nr:hypothetical protein BLX24_19095 [Arsenicibacter rosenii]